MFVQSFTFRPSPIPQLIHRHPGARKRRYFISRIVACATSFYVICPRETLFEVPRHKEQYFRPQRKEAVYVEEAAAHSTITCKETVFTILARESSENRWTSTPYRHVSRTRFLEQAGEASEKGSNVVLCECSHHLFRDSNGSRAGRPPEGATSHQLLCDATILTAFENIQGCRPNAIYLHLHWPTNRNS